MWTVNTQVFILLFFLVCFLFCYSNCNVDQTMFNCFFLLSLFLSCSVLHKNIPGTRKIAVDLHWTETPNVYTQVRSTCDAQKRDSVNLMHLNYATGINSNWKSAKQWDEREKKINNNNNRNLQTTTISLINETACK